MYKIVSENVSIPQIFLLIIQSRQNTRQNYEFCLVLAASIPLRFLVAKSDYRILCVPPMYQQIILIYPAVLIIYLIIIYHRQYFRYEFHP